MTTNTTLSRSQERTFHALIRAGLEILLKSGYDALNVTAITRRADYGRSTFYLYFQDKEDFVWMLMRDQAEQLDAYIAAEVEVLNYPQREIRAWEIIATQIEQQAPFWRQLDGETSQRLRQRQRMLLIEMFERNLREGGYHLPVDVAPEIWARFLVGTSQEILEFWLQHPDIGNANDVAQMLCKLIYRI